MDVKIDDLSRQYHDLQERYRLDAPDYADKATLLQSKQSLIEKRADQMAHELEHPDPFPAPSPSRLLRVFSGDLVIAVGGTVNTGFLTVPVPPEYWVCRLVSSVNGGNVVIEQQGGDYITLFVSSVGFPDWVPVPGFGPNIRLTLNGSTSANLNYLIYAVAGYDWFNFRQGGAWGGR